MTTSQIVAEALDLGATYIVIHSGRIHVQVPANAETIAWAERFGARHVSDERMDSVWAKADGRDLTIAIIAPATTPTRALLGA